MPILNLIPTTENVFGGLPRIAKLRKGAPKEERTRKDGSKYEVVGRDLDWLRVAFEPEYQHLNAAFKKLYGDKPKEFAAFLNADTVHEAFDFWKEDWNITGTKEDKGAITMLRRCDGQHKHVWFDGKHHNTAKVLCDVKGGGCGCKAVGRLNVILPQFTMETGVIGYFTIETHSEEDIRTLYARITSIWATFGKLRGVPLTFYRVPRKMTVPEIEKETKERTGKRIGKTMHMLDCRVQPEYTKQHFLAALTGQRAQLPAPPVSTLSAVPTTQRAIQLLNGDSSPIRASNGRKVDTMSREVLSDDSTEEILTPPDWYTPANRILLLNQIKENGLFKGGVWGDLLRWVGMTEEQCYPFKKGQHLYDHLKPLLEAKKQAQPEAAPEPPAEKPAEPVIEAPEAVKLVEGGAVAGASPFDMNAPQVNPDTGVLEPVNGKADYVQPPF